MLCRVEVNLGVRWWGGCGDEREVDGNGWRPTPQMSRRRLSVGGCRWSGLPGWSVIVGPSAIIVVSRVIISAIIVVAFLAVVVWGP